MSVRKKSSPDDDEHLHSDAVRFLTRAKNGLYITDIITFLFPGIEKGKAERMPSGGYKYRILIYKEGDDIGAIKASIEAFEATLGDIPSYVARIASIGYSGMLLKNYNGLAAKHIKAFTIMLKKQLGITKKKDIARILKELQCTI